MHRLRAITLTVFLFFVVLITCPGTAAHAMSRHHRGRTHASHSRRAVSHRNRVRRSERAHGKAHRHAAASVEATPNRVSLEHTFDLTHFDESSGPCRPEGRLQDRQFCASTTMDAIVAGGKAAIPTLIASLNDSRRVAAPIYDHWSEMEVGDVAYFILNDLFTDAPSRASGEVPWKSVLEGCGAGADQCWHQFVKKHGREFVQQQWLAAWNANKERVFWDEKATCFRVALPHSDTAETIRADFPLHPASRLLRRHRK
jgi:hypothetical protein